MMRLSGFGWVRSMNIPLRLCLCLVLICLITTGATGHTAGKPYIKLFEADPLVLNDGEAALYTFVVKNATEMQLVEAGNIIKEISNPSAATLKGTAQGMTTFAIRTGDSSTFTAVLIAKNDSGEAIEEITLSFATELEPAPLIPPVSATLLTPARSPQWLPQLPTSPPLIQPPSTTTHPRPEFAECPSDCKYCLQPSEAANLGFTQKCSEEICYYSPDNRKWYCHSEPEGWCCKDGKVFQATKNRCAEVGGYWYATQAEAIERCRQMELCWCCADGKVGQIPRDQCLQMGGTCHDTQAQAVRACQEMMTCWCCAGGKVGQVPQTQCIQMGGTCYDTQAQAVRACQEMATCWCCAGGKVFQAPQTQCIQMGGNCYTTQTQAMQACQPATCWCCAGGKVFQAPQTQCIQMGGNCYTTQAEAVRACQQGPTIPPPLMR
ncbi:MAG: hypothetical protein H8D32_05375 [Dehalococcoidia bacterium]|nr:hypothetical protein [Dehalococcoidia bacterium]